MSWFEYARTSDKHKEVLQGMRERGKWDVPFNIDGLEPEEQKVVVPYYVDKQPLHTIPLYLEDVPNYGLSWKASEDRTSSHVARTTCTTVYYGQRKLLVNEMLFLALYGLHHYPDIPDEKDTFVLAETLHSNYTGMPRVPKDKKVPILVYAGAGSGGQHLLYLCKLFKGVMFYCYDLSDYDKNLRSECEKGEYPNVALIQTMFMDKECDYFAHLSNAGYEVYFMSDIRSSGKQESYEEKEARVDIDNKMQYDWVERIRPVVAHLKWRTPYTLDNTKVMSPAVFMLEPWSGADSGELRQMVERPPKGQPYSYEIIRRADVETRMMTFNNIIKQYAHYKHPMPCSGYFYYDEKEKSASDSGLGMDHCWCCAYELIAWCVYLGYNYSKIRSATSDDGLFAFMRENKKALLWYFNTNTQINCRSLNINCHGLMPEKTSYEKYLIFADMDGKEHAHFVKNHAIYKSNLPVNFDCPYTHVDKGMSWFNDRRK